MIKNGFAITAIVIFAAVIISCSSDVAETDTTLPFVNILSPAPHSTIGRLQSIDINIQAEDNSGISKIDIYFDDDLYTSLTEEPYITQWTAPEENTNTILQIIANDNNGNQSVPAIVPLLVEGGAPGTMLLIAGGTLNMGDSHGIGDSDETPLHPIYLDDFYMGQFEVTIEEYFAAIEEDLPPLMGDNLPEPLISWFDAVHYCNIISIRDGFLPCYTINDTNVICDFTANGYRLPTEAEWEYAARGGTNEPDYKYAGSDNIDEVACYFLNSYNDVEIIGNRAPNSLGLYDMSGNTGEWCWDWYDEFYYRESYQNGDLTNPRGPAQGTKRVVRGGAYSSIDHHCRVSDRQCFTPETDYIWGLGLRLVRKVD